MSANPMPVSIIDWKPMRRNTLCGFAKILVGRSMTINDVAVHFKNGRGWAQAPGKPQIGSDGMVRKDESGKIQYTPVIQWIDRDASDRFSDGVVQALLAAHPNALSADAA